MNKKILAASAVLAAVSLSFGLTTWNGSEGIYQVETGFDQGDQTYGYWYDYNDANDGGTSEVVYPVGKGNAYSDDAMDPIIDYCSGVCGVATMGSGYEYPYVGIGFNIGGGDQLGYDISSWGGICLTYKSDGIAPALEIAPEGEQAMTGYNNYKASLKIAASNTTVNLAWTDFNQESGWGTKVDQSTVLAKAAAIKFKIATTAGKSTNFNIAQIGENGKCSGSVPNAIKSGNVASSVKASVAGRTLSLSGVKAGANVEVINLQGQVVLKSVLNSSSASLNLANMDAGVYMVRVAGSANFNQKIVLK